LIFNIYFRAWTGKITLKVINIGRCLHVKINKLAIFIGKLGGFFFAKTDKFSTLFNSDSFKTERWSSVQLVLNFCRYHIGLLLLAFDEQITQAKLYALLLCYSCLLCANLPLWRD